jgi:hypothetical protein
VCSLENSLPFRVAPSRCACTEGGAVSHHDVSVFILVQLNVQFLMFLKSLLAQHVSDVTASIVKITTVVYSHRFLVSGVFIPCDLYWCWATSSLYHGQFQSLAQHQYKSHGINTPETKNLWLYTTGVLLTMDAVTSETC